MTKSENFNLIPRPSLHLNLIYSIPIEMQNRSFSRDIETATTK